MEYQKINTIFLRDEKNIIMPDGPLVKPEFEWLRGCRWDATEKIDGTNIRLEVTTDTDWDKAPDGMHLECVGIRCEVDYKGRTDKANIPAHLLAFLTENYPAKKVLAALGLKWKMTNEECAEHNIDPMHPQSYTIYGEGYGVKIQSGGNYIRNGVGFIVFDVKVGNWWLQRDAMLDIAEKLGAPTVPYIGQMTIDEAIEFVRKGFKSRIAENPDYDAEGLVLKTPNGLLMRNCERLVVKVKTCDFRKYEKAVKS